GKDSQTVLDVEAGATSKTINGYRSAVKDALDAFAILGGADLDVRTEEEILAENLATALPAADEFEVVFVAEILEGVDTVYSAKNGAGYVFVCGEIFVGTDAQGKVTSDVNDKLKAKVESAAAILLASDSTVLDLSALEGVKKRIVSVKKTLSGNYIVRVEGSGYSIEGHYTSNTYMVIDISITPDGKIINCYTVSHDESEGYGAECEKYKFYSQFNGKGETNYGDIDAISGATITTDGYKKAVKTALDTVKMLVQEGM
ncbi:MAG: FMN-binding protein, partial [Clostridia bacterium]|nr:FMN-binding protein [Clostridia bacterium]